MVPDTHRVYQIHEWQSKLRNSILAVGVGFEPTDPEVNGFQDRLLQPLGHPTAGEAPNMYEYRHDARMSTKNEGLTDEWY